MNAPTTAPDESGAHPGPKPVVLDERLKQIFPNGLPSKLALKTAGIDVDRDVHDVATLAARIGAKRAELQEHFMKTKVGAMRTLILSLLTFVDEPTVAEANGHAAALDGDVPDDDAEELFRADEAFIDTDVADEQEADAPAVEPATVRAKREADPVNDGEMWKRYGANPGEAERNALVERYLPIVKYNAERIWARLPEGVELDDLKSAGLFGLMDAIEAFDVNRGVKFETYCVPRIRGAMLDELREMDWVPRLVRSKASKLHEAQSTLSAKLGRDPTVQELAVHMDTSVPELERTITEASAINLISLNKKWYETDSYKDVREIDILEDKKGEDPTKHAQQVDVLRTALRGLNRNERIIMIGYYWEEMTMKEIGATLGLSESRVSQMHSSIVARLQEKHKTKERFLNGAR